MAVLDRRYAIEGSLSTRWSSAPGVDPSWIEIDLGSVQTFDKVVLAWENAYASQYDIQVSNDNQTWTSVLGGPVQGSGGTETRYFPSTSARYIRMLGVQRATQYGYSLYEFQVFDAPQCGGATERYTVLGAQSGTWTSTIAGLPSGPYVPTVKDNVSGLVWQQNYTTFPQQGAQFTQTIAQQYCQSVGMRLPTQAEALTVARANYASCAFPSSWGTWTTTSVPSNSTDAYLVFSSGQSVPGITDNTPGWSLCVSGASVAAPAVTAQPASVSVTEGQSAQFTVGVTGTGPFNFQWLRNGALVAYTTTPSYTTPATTVANDNGAVYSVIVSNGGGSITSTTATLTVTAATTGTTGTTGNTGTGTTGTGTGGNTGTTSTSTTNLALGRVATSSGDQSAGYPASNAVDGSLASRWSSAFVDPSWIAVDLGSPQTVDRVVLRWQDAYGVQYQIQTSTDNVNWTTVYTQTAGQGGDEDIRFTAVTARYLRMYGTQRASQFGYSLYEFEVYNTANTPQFALAASASGSGAVSPAGSTAVYQGGLQTYTFAPASGSAVTGVQIDGQSIGLVNNSYTFSNVQATHAINVNFGPASAAANLALGSAATASGLESDAYPASAAVDGSLTTRWSSAFVDPSWIQLDLGSVQAFNRVILFWQNAYGVQYLIQTSNDQQNWTTVYTQSAGKGGIEDLTFPTVNARYVRMYGTQRNTQYGYSLWEFQVYNMPVAPVITTQPASITVNQGDTATFTVVAAGAGPLSYQWLQNGTAVATTTSPSYTTAATTASDNGSTFTVVISNAAGSVTSASATLSVKAVAPVITTQPASMAVALGSTATFNVTATGTAPLSYQWLENGTVLATTTSPSYTTAATTASDNGATFSVVVSNAGGSATSAGAALTVTAVANGDTGSGSGSVNLALSMAATASGVQDAGDGPANAVDGNLGSRWSSDFNDNAWITVDLGQAQAFNRVVLRWENAYGRAYLIQTSNDQQNWTTVYTQNAGQGGIEDIGFTLDDGPLCTHARCSARHAVRLLAVRVRGLQHGEYAEIRGRGKRERQRHVSPADSTPVYQGGSQTYTFKPAAGYAVTDDRSMAKTSASRAATRSTTSS